MAFGLAAWHILPLISHRMAGEGVETVAEQMSMRGGGTLTMYQDGPRVHMEAERPSDGRGLYKV